MEAQLHSFLNSKLDRSDLFPQETRPLQDGKKASSAH
jgi:hypothetical protein